MGVPPPGLGYCNYKKGFFRNLVDHVETVSVELVDFWNTCFNDSVHQSKAESRNEEMLALMEGRCGGTLIW